MSVAAPVAAAVDTFLVAVAAGHKQPSWTVAAAIADSEGFGS